MTTESPVLTSPSKVLLLPTEQSTTGLPSENLTIEKGELRYNGYGIAVAEKTAVGRRYSQIVWATRRYAEDNRGFPKTAKDTELLQYARDHLLVVASEFVPGYEVENRYRQPILSGWWRPWADSRYKAKLEESQGTTSVAKPPKFLKLPESPPLQGLNPAGINIDSRGEFLTYGPGCKRIAVAEKIKRGKRVSEIVWAGRTYAIESRRFPRTGSKEDLLSYAREDLIVTETVFDDGWEPEKRQGTRHSFYSGWWRPVRDSRYMLKLKESQGERSSAAGSRDSRKTTTLAPRPTSSQVPSTGNETGGPQAQAQQVLAQAGARLTGFKAGFTAGSEQGRIGGGSAGRYEDKYTQAYTHALFEAPARHPDGVHSHHEAYLRGFGEGHSVGYGHAYADAQHQQAQAHAPRAATVDTAAAYFLSLTRGQPYPQVRDDYQSYGNSSQGVGVLGPQQRNYPLVSDLNPRTTQNAHFTGQQRQAPHKTQQMVGPLTSVPGPTYHPRSVVQGSPTLRGPLINGQEPSHTLS